MAKGGTRFYITEAESPGPGSSSFSLTSFGTSGAEPLSSNLLALLDVTLASHTEVVFLHAQQIVSRSLRQIENRGGCHFEA